MPKAVKIDEESLTDVVAWGQSKGLNLDYLKDTYEYHAEDGDVLYMILDTDQWDKNPVATEMIAGDFFRIWKFVDGEMPNHFNEIEKI